MERPVDVSVVIPTRGRLELLRQSVASVMAQDGPRWELIVVDDASEDGTATWIAGVDDPRFRGIVLTQHGERSRARNAGLAQARGRYVLFLDDDDRLRPRSLAQLSLLLDQHDDAVVALGGVVWFDDGGATQRRWHPRRPVTLARPWIEVLFGWWPVPGQMLFRTDVVRGAGGWDEAWVPSEDIDLTLRVGTRGTFLIEPSTVLDYRVHPAQMARPPEMAHTNDRMLAHFAHGLTGADRALAERVLGSRAHVQEAQAAFLQAHSWTALRRYGRGVAEWPALLRSQPLRYQVGGPALRCLLGGRLLRFGRRTRAAVGPLRPGEAARARQRG